MLSFVRCRSSRPPTFSFPFYIAPHDGRAPLVKCRKGAKSTARDVWGVGWKGRGAAAPFDDGALIVPPGGARIPDVEARTWPWAAEESDCLTVRYGNELEGVFTGFVI